MTPPIADLEVTPSRRVPAWLLSLLVHLAVVVGVALVLPIGSPAGRSEPQRNVGIALARPDASERFAYTTEPDAPSADASRAAAQAAGGAAAGGSTESRAALPAAQDVAALLLPEIPLPGPALPGGVPDGLLVGELPLRGSGRPPILPGLDDAAILADEAARRAARKPQGPPTQVSVFGSAPATGRSFVFAIDRSKSTGGDTLNALAAASAELSRAIAHLTDQHEFQIVAYNHTCVYYRSPRLIPATVENKSGVPAFIRDLTAFGGTAHETAVRASLAMEPDAVFLLTDGGDPHLNEIVQKNLQALAAGRTTIHCIHFGYGAPADPDNFLRQLAQRNGGGYTYVPIPGSGEPPG